MSWFTIIYLCFLFVALVYLIKLRFEIDRSNKEMQKAMSDFADVLRKSAAKTEKLLKDIQDEKIRNQSTNNT
jgi:predicted Holliday junction resolvase-like endonuclease